MGSRGRLPGIKGWGLESRVELRDWSVDGNRDRRENRGKGVWGGVKVGGWGVPERRVIFSCI
jgi:hypothetical protein